MRRYKRSTGFTLIEVLIALAIIAIACTAVVKAVSDSIRVTTDLERHAAANWVASNVLAQIQSGVLDLPLPGTPVSGTSKMLNLQWHWVASSDQDGKKGSLSIVSIALREGLNKTASYHLKGYVWVSNPAPRSDHE
jgi:general secretion pathway protein I